MEFRHCTKACFLHFHEGEGRNGRDVFRLELVEEAVHDLAPRTEAVMAFWVAPLSQPGEGELEGVAVEVGDRRQKDRHLDGVAASLYIGRDGGNAPVIADRQADIVPPAGGCEGGARENLLHGAPVLT